ncbi:stigma-specific STIG1-like protein 3 [Durio zibethinus]|uniref:Stigma-specific STIG1-like protein 3 n=1 Tax=Durio zibethinus TaxID=66656 RepID=A0A6P5WQK8_DURZI|nr:stigma-specific STIG1-like protein 3 [Durio zibethinus]
MELTKIIVTLALTFAITIALAMKSIGVAEEKPTLINVIQSLKADDDQPLPMRSKRVSRFLKHEDKNPRAADRCHKDEEACYIQGGYNSTCCNNKCVDLVIDDLNCGACKRKCKFTQVCYRGECVYVSFDKRHCGGACNHQCNPGEYCVYGMCNYA